MTNLCLLMNFICLDSDFKSLSDCINDEYDDEYPDEYHNVLF